VYVRKQICPKRLVDLNYLQDYTACRVEQNVQEIKFKRNKIFKNCLLTKTSEINLKTLL